MSDKNDIKQNIIHGTIVIIIVTVLAKLASFVSTAVLAAYLGTTNQSDAVNTVLGVEQVFYPMIGVGIWKVFLPIYKENLVTDKIDEADKLANKTITLFTLITGVAVLALYIFTAGVVNIIAPGFDADTKLLSIHLIRISAPMYFFIIIAAVYSSMLQCHNNFFGSQVREIASHIPVIILAILCFKRFGIDAIAVGMLLGGMLRFFVELPFVKWGYKYRPDFHFRTSQMIDMVKKYPSAMMSEGVNQINVLIDKIMASVLTAGSVSALNYGNKLTNFLSGLLSTALSTALYPQFVELITLQQKDELKQIVIRVINLFSFLMMPITIGCVVFSHEIVAIVFQRGAFDDSSVALTSGVFSCYCFGLFFVACNTVITNLFYANGDTKTPLVISIINLVANIVLNIAFIKALGISGLALATSVSAGITFFIRLSKMKDIVNIPLQSIAPTFIKATVLSGIICIPIYLLLKKKISNLYLFFTASFLLACVVYVLIAWALKMDEMSMLISIIKRKLKK